VRQTFEANPVTYDGLPVFSASRPVAQQASALTGNLVSGTGSTLSLANIGAGLAAVNSFTGDPDLNPSGVPLNTPGKYLVVPAALAQQAAQILNSTVLLAAGTSNPVSLTPNRNPVRETILQPILQPVVERYLVNPTAWYILPDADDGPLMYITRRGKGMRPRLWRNIPMRQGIQGGGSEDYLLLVDDQIFGFDFDLSGVSYKPWASVLSARVLGLRPLPWDYVLLRWSARVRLSLMPQPSHKLGAVHTACGKRLSGQGGVKVHKRSLGQWAVVRPSGHNDHQPCHQSPSGDCAVERLRLRLRATTWA